MFMCKNVPNNLFMKLAAKNEIFMRKDDFFLIPTGTLAACSAGALWVGLAITVYKILVKMAADS